MSEALPPVQFLQILVDEHDESYFRILYAGKWVKFLTIGPDVFTSETRCFDKWLLPLLPPFPAGDWNHGYVAKDAATGEIRFVDTEKRDPPGIQHAWHPMRIDHRELSNHRERLRSNVSEVTCSQFNKPMIAKIAPFEWQIESLCYECKAYESIQGHDIGPRLLGHITKQERVIGFLMEKVDGARHAEVEDYELCAAALGKLHALGIKHGDINK